MCIDMPVEYFSKLLIENIKGKKKAFETKLVEMKDTLEVQGICTKAQYKRVIKMLDETDNDSQSISDLVIVVVSIAGASILGMISNINDSGEKLWWIILFALLLIAVLVIVKWIDSNYRGRRNVRKVSQMMKLILVLNIIDDSSSEQMLVESSMKSVDADTKEMDDIE